MTECYKNTRCTKMAYQNSKLLKYMLACRSILDMHVIFALKHKYGFDVLRRLRIASNLIDQVLLVIFYLERQPLKLTITLYALLTNNAWKNVVSAIATARCVYAKTLSFEQYQLHYLYAMFLQELLFTHS